MPDEVTSFKGQSAESSVNQLTHQRLLEQHELLKIELNKLLPLQQEVKELKVDRKRLEQKHAAELKKYVTRFEKERSLIQAEEKQELKAREVKYEALEKANLKDFNSRIQEKNKEIKSLEKEYRVLDEEFTSFKKKTERENLKEEKIKDAEDNAELESCQKESKKKNDCIVKMRGQFHKAKTSNNYHRMKVEECIKAGQLKELQINALQGPIPDLENRLRFEIRKTLGIEADMKKMRTKLSKAEGQLVCNETTIENLQEEIRLLKVEADEKNKALDKADQKHRSVKEDLNKVCQQWHEIRLKYEPLKESEADWTKKLDEVMAEKETLGKKLDKELQLCKKTTAQQNEERSLHSIEVRRLEREVEKTTNTVNALVLEKKQWVLFQKQLGVEQHHNFLLQCRGKRLNNKVDDTPMTRLQNILAKQNTDLAELRSKMAQRPDNAGLEDPGLKDARRKLAECEWDKRDLRNKLMAEKENSRMYETLYTEMKKERDKVVTDETTRKLDIGGKATLPLISKKKLAPLSG
ncbi:hypothetical protein VZT92_014019 [Zoarces viviparus]|uniref:Uncharacterized protein n=1 Tax=Zoarces viviparus TaxID=48416 RepID=A0AAW1EXN9_ZOAVI